MRFLFQWELIASRRLEAGFLIPSRYGLFGWAETRLTCCFVAYTGDAVIPDHLRTLFWEINLETFDPEAWPRYTIGRVLEYGDQDAVAWMRGLFTQDEIKRVIRTGRRLCRKSANYWALIYGLPRAEVAALLPSPHGER